jgi:hypothetical protein
LPLGDISDNIERNLIGLLKAKQNSSGMPV